MSDSRYFTKLNSSRTAFRKALLFGFAAVFLYGVGYGVISPVAPFLVEPYVNSPSAQATVVTLLFATYALSVFLAAPTLGALSDRFGRRPLLLICLTGLGIGFIVFGVGGALWVLFLGRIIEGLAGGSIGTIYAFFADIIPKEQRTKYFGWLSAVAGAGIAIGPTFGGLLANFDYALPMFVGGGIALLNAGFGLIFMPESLSRNERATAIPLRKLNPFAQLTGVLSMRTLRLILLSGFLLWVPNGSMQAILSQFTIDAFDWQPILIGLMFSLMGALDIAAQLFAMPQLIKRLRDDLIAQIGMVFEVVAYAFIAASAVVVAAPLFVIGIVLFGLGDAIFGPSFNGLLSKSASSKEQGKALGTGQSIQALARVIGPIAGGQLYVLLGQAAPAIMGFIMITLSVLVLRKRK